jgi:phage replication-related protein YjqB (UPF0714/DUF867 family)
VTHDAVKAWKLDGVSNRQNFEGFAGLIDSETKDFICAGGSNQSADNGLIGEIKDAIKNTLIAYESNIDVKDSECPECQEEFNGKSTDNIVNRLGTNGIQIEQCLEARKQYYTYIAKAVTDIIRFIQPNMKNKSNIKMHNSRPCGEHTRSEITKAQG